MIQKSYFPHSVACTLPPPLYSLLLFPQVKSLLMTKPGGRNMATVFSGGTKTQWAWQMVLFILTSLFMVNNCDSFLLFILLYCKLSSGSWNNSSTKPPDHALFFLWALSIFKYICDAFTSTRRFSFLSLIYTVSPEIQSGAQACSQMWKLWLCINIIYIVIDYSA